MSWNPMDWNWAAVDWKSLLHLATTIIAFCALFYTIYRDSFRRPKLKLLFDNAQDVIPQENTLGLPAGARSRWLRLRVQNVSRWKSAKNCRAFVLGAFNVAPHDVRQLFWTHDHSPVPAARDLLPGLAHWVDLAAAVDVESHLRVCAFPPMNITTPNVPCILTVQVSAEETDPVVIKIRVHWDGNFQSLRGEIVK